MRLAAALMTIALLSVAPVTHAGQAKAGAADLAEVASTRLRHETGLALLDGAPFSGVAVTRYPGGALATRETWIAGRRHGLSIGWHENGSLAAMRRYASGEKDGVHAGWWRDGRERYRMRFENGRLQGESLEWYDNGVLSTKLAYVDGRQSGLQAGWDRSGKQRFAYAMRDGRRYGVVDSTPCAEPATAAASKSDDALPTYDDATLTPRWKADRKAGAASHRVALEGLRDQSGRAIGTPALDGRITVVNFFFTGCGNVCPVSMRLLKDTRDALRQSGISPGFISITVAPLQDSVGALADYAKRNGLDDGWRLATGDAKSIESQAKSELFSDIGTAADAARHTELVFLLDGGRRIRGVYNATQPADLKRLAEDVRVLQAAARA